ENQASSYKRKMFPEWKFDILDNSVDIVASFRVNLKYLEQIINTEKPVTMSTIVFIIIDDPNSPNIITLKKQYETNPFVKIREHKTNLGA
ncbi:16688_t:CDS:2, partial [Funneliformis caledonium]